MKYTLTLSENQMREVFKATELFMRLKLGQYQELIYALCDISSPTEHMSLADSLFKEAFKIMNADKKPADYKDAQWETLYDLYQVMRKGINNSEPEPIQASKEPLAKCKRG